MFFPRLRRRAKWAFAFLALAFALTFVVAGVGTGFGSGIGDYFSDIFNRQPGQGADIADAREAARKNPKSEEALDEYLDAIQAATNLSPDQRIAELQRYLKLRSKDENALQELAGLYLLKAGEADQRLAALNFESQSAGFGDEVQDPNGVLAKGLGPAPITSAIRGDANERYQAVFAEAQDAYRKEADVWRQLTALNPDEPSYFLELGRASTQSQDYPAAILAYNRYLELAPDAANAAEIKNLVQQLQIQTRGGNLVGQGGTTVGG